MTTKKAPTAKSAKAPKLAPIPAISDALAPSYDAILTSIKEQLYKVVDRINKKLETQCFNDAFPIFYNKISCNADKAAKALAAQFTRDATEEELEAYNSDPTTAESRKQYGHVRRFTKYELRFPMSAEEVEVEITKSATIQAKDALISYGHKLSDKTREHFGEKAESIKAATYSGSRNPWSYSLIQITFNDGTTGTLSTQMIINVSPLGKLFNQFPTRLVK